MNEPEGSVKIEYNKNPCFRTDDILAGSGTGWSKADIPIKNL